MKKKKEWVKNMSLKIYLLEYKDLLKKKINHGWKMLLLKE